MKLNKIVVSLLSAGVLASPLAYATNGDTMMSVGSENAALGGTGVAHFVGAESTFANPAMLGKSKGSEVTGGFVYFKPTVSNNGNGGTDSTSGANPSYIPDISYSSRINDSLTYGVALAGIAGMGVDYTGAAKALFYAKTSLSIAQLVPTIAYNTESYGIGFSPVVQYGSLMIAYNSVPAYGAPPNGTNQNPANNADSYTGYGFNLGGYFNATPALTLAAAYKSQIDMNYGTQLSGAGRGFSLYAGSPKGAGFGDTLSQPAEMKAGLAYVINDNYTLTTDYKLIQWSSATGYKDFNWSDQNVVALGGKYTGNGYWLGLGYNYANDPIGALSGSVYRNAVVNFFNNEMFPGVVTTSYTFGGGYSISKNLGIDASAVITPQVTKTVDISGMGGATTNTTYHSQQAASVSLRYKF